MRFPACWQPQARPSDRRRPAGEPGPRRVKLDVGSADSDEHIAARAGSLGRSIRAAPRTRGRPSAGAASVCPCVLSLVELLALGVAPDNPWSHADD